ncbi:Colon cancer associated Mic1 [Echinococcus multilocularis]|uniref:Colon cancer associated Mic1 n=1 Tax=Echinococcus multilocularis TaxID=6211 RepID=A0A068Y3Q5_ECHMU|nr:Colon cancer associated Mic1 [Echinococcus multilocularis]
MISFASLSPNPLVFEPISSMNSVYYDPANGQVFTLRARGAMGVNVKSLESRKTSNFRICDKGEVLSIKFDPNCTVLSLQRKRNCVDFINFENGRPEDIEYSQTCKKTASSIIGFIWSSDNEIIFVTNEGFELYQVLPDSHLVRALKHGSVQTNWYAWDPLNKILLLSTGDLGNRIHVTSFANGFVTKCSSFEVPEEEILSPSSTSTSAASDDLKKLQQKNCLLANLYGQLYACILSHSLEGGVQLILYQLMRRGPVRRRHVLVVPEVGRIAVSFVRDLVLVHHQHSRTSLAYDIASAAGTTSATRGLSGNERLDDYGGPQYHYPLLPPVSLAEVSIPCKNVPALSLEPGTEFHTPLYTPSWIIIPPNVVIDGSLGCLWTVDLNLEAFTKLIPDPITLVDCLLNRPGAKSVLRHYCQDMGEKLVKASTKTPSEGDDGDSFVQQLEIVSHLLSRLADVQKAARKASKISRSSYLSGCDGERSQETVPSEPIRRFYRQPLVFSPDDVYETVFAPLASFSNDLKIQKILSHLILGYISDLKSRSLVIDHLFYTLLVESLVKSRDFSRLVHLLRSNVIVDSTEMANQLLSFESAFPPAGRLALDMLRRLGTSNESIVEVLLAKGDPIMALRFCKDHRELLGLQDTPRKILDAAKLCEDPMIFYSAFRFFERAAPLAPSLVQDPKFRPYLSYFANLFGPGSLVLTNIN